MRGTSRGRPAPCNHLLSSQRWISRIGFLHPGFVEAANLRIAAVHEGLRDQCSRDDLDVEIVRAVAAEAPTRLAVLAQELATNGVDVIIAVSPSVRTAKDATGSIPIIAVDLELDPVLLSSPVFGSSQQLVAELALKNQLPSLMLST